MGIVGYSIVLVVSREMSTKTSKDVCKKDFVLESAL